VKSLPRLLVLALILSGVAGGAWYATRGTAPERRNLDALVTVGGDVVHDAGRPILDLTRLSTAEEMELGRAIDAEIRARAHALSDPAIEAYVQAVLRQVAAHAARTDIRYSVAVLDSSEVQASAVAGGHLYVTAGMLAFIHDEAELAAVLGHEVSHVELGHCVRALQIEQAARRIAPDLAGLARLGYELMERGFSEEQELAADAGGALLSAKAEYDPWRANTLFARFLERDETGARKPGRNPIRIAVLALPDAIGRYLATHPPADQRIEAVRRVLLSREEIWKGVPRYIGAANLAVRRCRSDEALAEEWITRSRAP
jgi:predicted Zn-dependent protease